MKKDSPAPKKCEKGAPKWMVTYGDMMTLLLTFFIMMLSFANMDVIKFRDVTGSVEKAFGIQRVIKEPSPQAGMPMPIPMEADPNRREAEKDRLVNLLQAMATEEGVDRTIFITKDQRGVKMEIAGSVMFAPGDIRLLPEAERLFRRMMPMIRETPYKIIVEGHTDDLPIRSERFPSNWELSAVRSAVVVRFFVDDGGIEARRFMAQGMAETRPIVENLDAESRARNRRVNLVFEIF